MELSLTTSSASPAVLRRQASPLLHKQQQVLGLTFASALKPGGALRFTPRRRPLHRPITCSVSPSTAEPSSEVKKKKTLVRRDDVRNIAIVAHVDHGKTTLVDSMLRQAKVFRDNQVMQERIMDSNDLERERGITILSKNTSITYKNTKVNIIDTPGHSDFGGEVERVLNMVDGVLLVVDSVEGPMPQTRFVLKKALEFGHAVVVVVNKIDRPSARPEFVVNSTFELFIELNATDEQCDFQAIYASGIKGKAGLTPDDLSEDLGPLFEAIIRCVPGPNIEKDGALQMLATNIEYDEHKGRIAIGRLHAGALRKGMDVRVCTSEDSCRFARVSELFVYEKFYRVPADTVEAGDICAVCGIDDIQIGETIADKVHGKPLPTIKVEEPTVKMSFSVNTSPFSGREGKYVTSRNLRDRLNRELERNLAMKVEDGETADTFIISGRGTLHITILIENMRREGYEFMVGPPKVINKRVNDKLLEPFEVATVEVPENHMGPVVELLGRRRGQMFDMQGVGSEGTVFLRYKIPTRGLLGLRNAILTASRGTAILNTVFDSYGPWAGDISTRDLGSLVAFEDGTSTSYALASSQERGQMFVGAGVDVYKVVLDTPLTYSLDDCIEYIEEDELVEVTPLSIRMCKNPKMAKKGRQDIEEVPCSGSSRMELKRSHQWLTEESGSEVFSSKRQVVEIDGFSTPHMSLSAWESSLVPRQLTDCLFDPANAQHSAHLLGRNISSADSQHIEEQSIGFPVVHGSSFDLDAIRKVRVNEVCESGDIPESMVQFYGEGTSRSFGMGPSCDSTLSYGQTCSNIDKSFILPGPLPDGNFSYDKGDENVFSTFQPFEKGVENFALMSQSLYTEGNEMAFMVSSQGRADQNNDQVSHADRSKTISFGDYQSSPVHVINSFENFNHAPKVLLHTEAEENMSFEFRSPPYACPGVDTLLVPKSKDSKTAKKGSTNTFPSNVKSFLSTGVLDGVTVKYYSWSREKNLKGVIKGTGYLCGCGDCNLNKVLNAYEFEQHANCKTKHPNNHIYFENGKTIYGVVQELKNTPQEKLFDAIQNVTGSVINHKNFNTWKASYQVASLELQRIYGKDVVTLAS
uniref:Tr-type G domain-containing protein n=1 Tax=Brassica campestris TaxID=3711 RepID=M4E3S4_BRACM